MTGSKYDADEAPREVDKLRGEMLELTEATNARCAVAFGQISRVCLYPDMVLEGVQN